MLSFLASPLGCQLASHNVVELGCGTGLAGLYAAHQGAHVLLTDVRSMTDLIKKNIDANCSSAGSATHWVGASAIGQGDVTCMTLDWMKCVSTQSEAAGQDLSQTDYVIAAEVIWLQEILQPFVDTLAYILRQPHQPVCFMTYTRYAADHDSLCCMLKECV